MTKTTRRVATDVGGTFTDLVAFETGPDGLKITTAKSDTTPPNFEAGVLNVLEKGGIDPATVDFMAHGTTVVINALTERKGVPVGLITTEGFRDVLEIARGNRPDFFNLHYEKPKPFVPRYLRREVPGRPVIYATTPEFLDHFGLSSRRDLPGMDELKAAGLLDPVDDAFEEAMGQGDESEAEEHSDEQDSCEAGSDDAGDPSENEGVTS